jgi:hypothetical protein
MHSEAIPDFGGRCGAERLHQRLLATNVEIVHHQVNRLGCRVCQRQGDSHLSEFKTRTIRRGECEMSTRFRLYGAKTLAVPQRSYSLSRLASRPGRDAILLSVLTPVARLRALLNPSVLHEFLYQRVNDITA